MPLPSALSHGPHSPKPVNGEKFVLSLLHAAAFALPLWAVILKLLGVI